MTIKCEIKGIYDAKQSAPDYIVTSKAGNKVNIDLKTLSYVESIWNIKSIQEQFLQQRVEMEEIRNGGSRTETSGVVQRPFSKVHAKKSATRREVIEAMIGKVDSAYKKKQLAYEGNPGILLLDTVILGYPVFMQEALPYFLYPNNKCLMSGLFWHTCFGKEGERTFDWPPGSGEVNIGEPLQRNGVLIGDTSLKAVIFTIRLANEIFLAGFHRCDLKNEAIGEILYQVCDFVNNDYNTAYYRLNYDPLIQRIADKY